MANVKWSVKGQYFEACNCDYVCPCIYTNLAGEPTYGHCDVALMLHIDQGKYGNVKLDGLNFVILMHSPGTMGKGNIGVGLITDQRATPEQQEALMQIGSGQAGGPIAALAPLVGKMLGAASAAIQFDGGGMKWSGSVPGMLDLAIEGMPGADNKQPIYMENTVHPVSSRLAFAKASRSHMHAFGIDFDTTTGANNGHFAPFNWQA